MIYHKGRWLIAPEIKALLDKLEDMNEELRSEADRVLRENTVLREKQESADRQIAEYKRILKAAVDDVRYCMRSYDPCEVCALLEENGECVAADDDDCSEKYKWRYEAEALALIGRTVKQMAKRKCLLTFYPTKCEDDCFNCDCGGAEATKDMGTVGITIYFLCRLWWDKWGQYWFRFHKHLYHVHSIWQINDTERGCEKWSICFKCEKCNKEKEIAFWNDKIKLKTVKDGDTNE